MIGLEDTGLRGVKAATSRISLVDGKAGKLLYRGYAIEDLARESNYEEVCYLLLHQRLPRSAQLRSFSRELASERSLPSDLLELLRGLPPSTPPMAVIQAGVALLAADCPDMDDDSIEANRRKASRIIAKLPTMVAAWKRIRVGQEIVKPRPSLSHAANFLYMIRGEEQDASMARFMDVALILHADHGFNASTFTARAVASTRASMYAAVSAGIAALSGTLHGGANAQVMKNLLEIDDPDNVEEWVDKQFHLGRRVSGMGHAVYRTIDPRAAILRDLARTVLMGRRECRWYEMTERMVKATQEQFRLRKGREIYPNIDMYSASLYHSLGIHHDFYPAVFAMARSAGWAAHVLEEKFPRPPVKPVLYRPSCLYLGEYNREYIPIMER